MERKIDEDQLLAGLRRGEDKCFEILVRQHGGRMLAVAKRYVRSEADAFDCVQEAYLSAFKKIDSFEGRSSLQSWLHRIVVNKALMKLRSQHRHPEESLEGSANQFDHNGMRIASENETSGAMQLFHANHGKSEVQKLVREGISKLPTNFSNLLMLRDIIGHSTKETANMLSMTEGAVKTGLHRARAMLKSYLEQQEPRLINE